MNKRKVDGEALLDYLTSIAHAGRPPAFAASPPPLPPPPPRPQAAPAPRQPAYGPDTI